LTDRRLWVQWIRLAAATEQRQDASTSMAFRKSRIMLNLADGVGTAASFVLKEGRYDK